MSDTPYLGRVLRLAHPPPTPLPPGTRHSAVAGAGLLPPAGWPAFDPQWGRTRDYERTVLGRREHVSGHEHLRRLLASHLFHEHGAHPDDLTGDLSELASKHAVASHPHSFIVPSPG